MRKIGDFVSKQKMFRLTTTIIRFKDFFGAFYYHFFKALGGGDGDFIAVIHNPGNKGVAYRHISRKTKGVVSDVFNKNFIAKANESQVNFALAA